MRLFPFLLAFLIRFLGCDSGLFGGSRPVLVAVFSTDLFENPSPTSRKIAAIEKGECVADQFQSNPTFSKIEFEGRVFEEPFAFVSKKNGQIGWVFCGAVRAEKAPAFWLRRVRAESFFSKNLFRSKNDFQNAFEKAVTEVDLAAAFRKGQLLRDSIAAVFEKKATSQPSDYFWTAAEMPAFIPQKRTDGRGFSLFCDFGKWAEKATATAETSDDAFFKMWLLAFPEDSIESDFPIWRQPISEAATCSNLGSGGHIQMFEMMANSFKMSTLWQPEILILKNQLLTDITSTDEKYWQPREKMLAELDAILKRDWPFLSKNERAEIGLRRAMFEAAEANSIRVNLRSGE